jgi:hypothetical protein
VRARRVDRIEEIISLWGYCYVVRIMQMYLWMSRREHALADRRAGWLSLRPRSMAASSVRLMGWRCIEVTRILREDCEDGSVATTPRGAETSFLEPSVQTKVVRPWAKLQVSWR